MAFWLWIGLAIVVVCLVGMLCSRIHIRVRYSRSGRLDQLVIVIQALYGLFHYQMILPSIVIRGWNVVYREKTVADGLGTNNEHSKKRKINKRTFRKFLKAYRTILMSTKKFRIWARQSLKKVECTRWRLDFRVGTGDAPSTAVVSGLLWAVSGCASGVAGEFVTLKTSPHGQVEPNYTGTEFAVVWEADFRIRASTACWAGLKLGANTIRIGKAIRAWRSMLSATSKA